jgi:hypothetical protein
MLFLTELFLKGSNQDKASGKASKVSPSQALERIGAALDPVTLQPRFPSHGLTLVAVTKVFATIRRRLDKEKRKADREAAHVASFDACQALSASDYPDDSAVDDDLPAEIDVEEFADELE